MSQRPKECFIKAFRHEEAPCIPAMEIEFQLYREYTGKSPIVAYEFAKLSSKEKELAHGYNAEVLIEAANAVHHAALKDIGAYWEIGAGVAADLWMPSLEDRLNHLKALKKEAADDFFIFGTIYFPLRIPYLGDLTEYSLQLFEKPDEIRAQSKQRLEDACILQDKLIEAGADGIINDCDVACNSGSLLSPAMMDDFFFPYLFDWVVKCRRDEIFCVWHSDGNLDMLMDRIIDSGVHALHSIDPTAGMNIVELMGRVCGKMTLIGNLDCSIIHMGIPEDCYAETTKILESCFRSCRGGHIFSACNTIFHGIPKENYDAVINARLDFDRKIVGHNRAR
jgi:uroporphyrinogen decarboxylase